MKNKKKIKKRCPQCGKLKDSVCYRPNSYRQNVGNEPDAYWTACDECDEQNKLDI